MPERQDICVSLPCDACVSFVMILQHLITEQSFKKKFKSRVNSGFFVYTCLCVCEISFV